MEKDLITQLVKEIVLGEVFGNWVFWVLICSLFILATLATAFLAAYLTKKGENFATSEGFNELLGQLKKQTEVTEKIRVEVSHGEWTLKEYKLLRRNKLEALVELIESVSDWLVALDRSVIFDSAFSDKSPFGKFRMLQELYFPELEGATNNYREAYDKCHMTCLVASRDRAKLQTYEEKTAHLESTSKSFLSRYEDVVKAGYKVRKECIEIMNKTILV